MLLLRQREHVPTLIGVYCAPHWCALATLKVAKAIPEFDLYSRTESSLFHYINSALHANKLCEIQNFFNLSELKNAEAHSVRNF